MAPLIVPKTGKILPATAPIAAPLTVGEKRERKLFFPVCDSLVVV
jgi:hypothetical protein